LSTQDRFSGEKCSAVWMSGKATFTMVASSTTISWQVRMTSRMRVGEAGRRVRPDRSRRFGAGVVRVSVADAEVMRGDDPFDEC
jgi:hypothetical protein